MISLICGILKKKIQQTSEHNEKEDSDIENKLVVTSGGRVREGQQRGGRVADTSYYCT